MNNPNPSIKDVLPSYLKTQELTAEQIEQSKIWLKMFLQNELSISLSERKLEHRLATFLGFDNDHQMNRARQSSAPSAIRESWPSLQNVSPEQAFFHYEARCAQVISKHRGDLHAAFKAMLIIDEQRSDAYKKTSSEWKRTASSMGFENYEHLDLSNRYIKLALELATFTPLQRLVINDVIFGYNPNVGLCRLPDRDSTEWTVDFIVPSSGHWTKKDVSTMSDDEYETLFGLMISSALGIAVFAYLEQQQGQVDPRSLARFITGIIRKLKQELVQFLKLFDLVSSNQNVTGKAVFIIEEGKLVFHKLGIRHSLVD